LVAPKERKISRAGIVVVLVMILIFVAWVVGPTRGMRVLYVLGYKDVAGYVAGIIALILLFAAVYFASRKHLI